MANANARASIFDNGDFSLCAQLVPVSSPRGGLALTITSQRKESRKPEDEQVKFFACLDREGVQSLGDLIQRALKEETPGGQK